MKVLAIDTSNFTLSVAVADGQAIIGEYTTNIKKNHSLRAMPAIDELMKEVGLKPKDLDKIVVAAGPGSFTGVRIGVTIAKTLAWTLNIPIVPVSSLQLIAQNALYFDGYISPIFDARRGLVFTGLYEGDNETVNSIQKDCNILLTDWLEIIKEKKKKTLFIGNDVEMHKQTIQDVLNEDAVFAPYTLNNPSAKHLITLGMHNESKEVHSVEPIYLRLAEAEANWLAQQKLGE
jgi:tRNA threonylcarbamoyladenosine biosynthesis protein TsaB